MLWQITEAALPLSCGFFSLLSLVFSFASSLLPPLLERDGKEEEKNLYSQGSHECQITFYKAQ